MVSSLIILAHLLVVLVQDAPPLAVLIPEGLGAGGRLARPLTLGLLRLQALTRRQTPGLAC